jgi:hypothetical protein
MKLNRSRQVAREAIKASVPESLWLENESFLIQLREHLKAHSLTRHPVIEALNQSSFDREAIKYIHLDYRHAIVQSFTDALLMAQFQSRQLEPRLKPGCKMYARFLLTLNVLDEFGFCPGVDSQDYYQGDPQSAHYLLFEQVLDELGITLEERLTHTPSLIADSVRRYLEDSYTDFNAVISLLAVAEAEVILFSPPLGENTRTVGVNVDSGYYYFHGTSFDSTVEANDDNHEDDFWYILAESITPDEYKRISSLCERYCDLWVEFWNVQIELLTKHN